MSTFKEGKDFLVARLYAGAITLDEFIERYATHVSKWRAHEHTTLTDADAKSAAYACALEINNAAREREDLLTEHSLADIILRHFQAARGNEDTQLLDWLIAHGAFLSHSRDGDLCNVWFSQDPDDDSNGAVPVEGYPQKCYEDARAAIRAARAAVQERKKP